MFEVFWSYCHVLGVVLIFNVDLIYHILYLHEEDSMTLPQVIWYNSGTRCSGMDIFLRVWYWGNLDILEGGEFNVLGASKRF